MDISINVGAAQPLDTHLRNLPKGTVAIFALLYNPPITITKMVDGTWIGWDGDREITVTTNAIYKHRGSLTIIHMPKQ